MFLVSSIESDRKVLVKVNKQTNKQTNMITMMIKCLNKRIEWMNENEIKLHEQIENENTN